MLAMASDRSTAATGLSQTEAQRRLDERGQTSQASSSRSYASIIRANVLTVFNLILAVFGAITLIFGDWRDALFLTILVANSAIGIFQEVRAKRTLDRLALLVAPQATVIRDHARRQVATEQLVEDDLVVLQAGDQILTDGRLVAAEGLAVDESILTGESEPVSHGVGDQLRAGAFVTEGTAQLIATAAGGDSYADRLLGQARSFRHPRSPLEQAVNRLLFALVGLVIIFGAALGYALWHTNATVSEAVATSTAGVTSLVPEGLVVLVSLTYAVASRRMARRGVLAQQLNAIESLASANVICLDKTGTLTEPALRVTQIIPAAGTDQQVLEQALARYGASSSVRNTTLEAVANAFPGTAEPAQLEVPFSSRRRWSGVALADQTLLLGAPERFDLGMLEEAAARERRSGRRVVALASAPESLPEQAPDAPPDSARVLGLVVLAEQLRPDTRQTVKFLTGEGVELKVLSGDNPETVAAIARDAGIPDGDALAGDELSDNPARLRQQALSATVVGRISPDGKRRIVETLRDEGRYVAMVGDGVNDVPALKSARLAIAQGTGTQMAKGVSDLVLVNGEFSAVPRMIAEGRRTLRNLQRVARLYVTKSSFAAFLILTIGITSTAYPLLPRHFTLAAALTIGIPTFFLALAPSSGEWRPRNFGRQVARFAVPAGIITGVGVATSYLFAGSDLDLSVTQARTTATTVLIVVGLYLVIALEAEGGNLRRSGVVAGMAVLLAALYVCSLAFELSRSFFQLAPPGPAVLITALVGAGISIGALYLSGFPQHWRPSRDASTSTDSAPAKRAWPARMIHKFSRSARREAAVTARRNRDSLTDRKAR
jgi:magnesium-transporting ATPase (P-type)